jgi:predicted ATPase
MMLLFVPTALTRICVKALHGRDKSIDIPLAENRLVLVGENGSGKSTLANLTYYLLTQQWHRLAEYRFQEISVSTASNSVTFTHEDVESLGNLHTSRFGRDMLSHVPPSARRDLAMLLSQASLFEDDDVALLRRIAATLDMPLSSARFLMREFKDSETVRLKKIKKHVVEATKQLDSWDFGQFLYLPTYRRIEHDLKSIFPGIEIEEKVRGFRERLRRRDRSPFIELIEFGMEDVEKTISSRMSQIKENVRTGLSTLTGTYLREVLRGLQDSPDLAILQTMDAKELGFMFARIDDSILPSVDKALLQTKIAEINEGRAIRQDDRVIAHFLSKLVSLYRQQQSNESDVREFVEICNAYLTSKKFTYDETNYDVYIKQLDSDSSIQSQSEPSEKVALRMLSSGEKQIVSLFSHMYLSGESKFFVVIDEPELSLSVPWQQRFLPDILGTGRCNGLIAVTHSPFIWDNELEQYVKPLAEFVRSTNVLH